MSTNTQGGRSRWYPVITQSNSIMESSLVQNKIAMLEQNASSKIRSLLTTSCTEEQVAEGSSFRREVASCLHSCWYWVFNIEHK